MICTLYAELLHGRSGRPTGRPIEIWKGSSNLNLLKFQLVYQLVYPIFHLMQILCFLQAKQWIFRRLRIAPTSSILWSLPFRRKVSVEWWRLQTEDLAARCNATSGWWCPEEWDNGRSLVHPWMLWGSVRHAHAASQAEWDDGRSLDLLNHWVLALSDGKPNFIMTAGPRWNKKAPLLKKAAGAGPGNACISKHSFTPYLVDDCNSPEDWPSQWTHFKA